MKEPELVIDFKALLALIISKWPKGLIFGSIFFVFGAIFLLSKPNEYKSSAHLLPELESTATSGLGRFAGLASLAGIDLSSLRTSDAVRPDLYPNIINSNSYFLFLLNKDVITYDGTQVKFKDFYLKSYDLEESDISEEPGWIGNLKELLNLNVKIPPDFNKDTLGTVVLITKFEGEIIEALREKISASMDNKTGIITISVELPDPVVAADVARISMEYLTEFVVSYRTGKTQQELDYFREQLASSKYKFYAAQKRKADYSDSFQLGSIRLQSADVKRDRIEREFEVSSNIYSQIIQQYEAAKMELEREKPVFKNLDPPYVPYKKSGPPRVIILILLFLLGNFSYFFYLLINNSNYKRVFYKTKEFSEPTHL